MIDSFQLYFTSVSLFLKILDLEIGGNPRIVTVTSAWDGNWQELISRFITLFVKLSVMSYKQRNVWQLAVTVGFLLTQNMSWTFSLFPLTDYKADTTFVLISKKTPLKLTWISGCWATVRNSSVFRNEVQKNLFFYVCPKSSSLIFKILGAELKRRTVKKDK